MQRSVRTGLRISAALFLLAIAPAFLFALGLLLNVTWGCDIRDESGTVYGDCGTLQSDITYSLMMMPWLLLFTIPVAGGACALALLLTLLWQIFLWHKQKAVKKRK